MRQRQRSYERDGAPASEGAPAVTWTQRPLPDKLVDGVHHGGGSTSSFRRALTRSRAASSRDSVDRRRRGVEELISSAQCRSSTATSDHRAGFRRGSRRQSLSIASNSREVILGARFPWRWVPQPLETVGPGSARQIGARACRARRARSRTRLPRMAPTPWSERRGCSLSKSPPEQDGATFLETPRSPTSASKRLLPSSAAHEHDRDPVPMRSPSARRNRAWSCSWLGVAPDQRLCARHQQARPLPADRRLSLATSPASEPPPPGCEVPSRCSGVLDRGCFGHRLSGLRAKLSSPGRDRRTSER